MSKRLAAACRLPIVGLLLSVAILFAVPHAARAQVMQPMCVTGCIAYNVDVQDIAEVPHLRTLELSANVMEGSVWENLTIERYRSACPIPIQPFVIREEGAVRDGLVRDWEPPDFGIDRHYGYAFQWFALAVTILVFYAITRHRRRRDSQT